MIELDRGASAVTGIGGRGPGDNEDGIAAGNEDAAACCPGTGGTYRPCPVATLNPSAGSGCAEPRRTLLP